jgi:hypothetical protein
VAALRLAILQRSYLCVSLIANTGPTEVKHMRVVVVLLCLLGYSFDDKQYVAVASGAAIIAFGLPD